MTAPGLYLALCVAGTLLPLWQFLPFLPAHGLDVYEFLRQLFATPVSAFFAMDVVVSSLVLWTLVLIEGPARAFDTVGCRLPPA